MAKTKVENVYCWTGNHEIDPAQWMSQAGMCRVCYDSIESDVLTAHAEPVTDPRLDAVSGQECGICGRPSAPGLRCAEEVCKTPLCQHHAYGWDVGGHNEVFCPDHRKRGV